MKKFVIVLLLLFIFTSNIAHSTIEYSYKQYVKHNIYRALDLVDSEKIKRQWNKRNIDKLATVLIAAENHTDINHKHLLATILTESDMKINCVPRKRNKNRTIDYGLVQQNSKYLKIRYRSAKKLLRRSGIKYTDNIFDISVNVMSGAIVLRDYRSIMKSRGVKDRFAPVAAYNVGPSGFFKKKLASKKRAYLHRYKRFLTKL